SRVSRRLSTRRPAWPSQRTPRAAGGRVSSRADCPRERIHEAIPELEHAQRQRNTALLELPHERRPKTRGPETADDFSVVRDLVDLELEELLHRDHVGLHPLYLCDRSDAARTVFEPLEVDDRIEGG